MTTWHGTRACRGCDGSGYDYKRPDLSTFDSFEDCMVCGGTGRVEARPPVSDANADLQTLLLNTPRSRCMQDGIDPYGNGGSQSCSRMGNRMSDGRYLCWQHARAAFRVVLGLSE